MESAQKAIMIGVGLFITIIIIAAVMTITGIGQDLLNRGQSELAGLSTQLRSQLQSGYDQILMTEERVISTIVKYYTENSVAIYLYPQIKSNTKTAVSMAKIDGNFLSNNIGIDTAEILIQDPKVTEIPSVDRVKLGDFGDSNKADTYIVPHGKYKSVLIKNADNAQVLGIAILRYQ